MAGDDTQSLDRVIGRRSALCGLVQALAQIEMLFTFASSIFFFTSGSLKDFALVLFVGMISGTYSTLYITVQVTHRLHLAKVIRGVRNIPEVVRIGRLKGDPKLPVA